MQWAHRESNVTERLVKIPHAIAGLTSNPQTGGPGFSFGVFSPSQKVPVSKTASF